MQQPILQLQSSGRASRDADAQMQQQPLPMNIPAKPQQSGQLRKKETNALHLFVSGKHGKYFKQARTQINDLTKNNPEFLNAQDEKGNTPLHLAIASDKRIAINTLLAQQADVSISNNKGETPYQLAKKKTREYLEAHHPVLFSKYFTNTTNK